MNTTVSDSSLYGDLSPGLDVESATLEQIGQALKLIMGLKDAIGPTFKVIRKEKDFHVELYFSIPHVQTGFEFYHLLKDYMPPTLSEYKTSELKEFRSINDFTMMRNKKLVSISSKEKIDAISAFGNIANEREAEFTQALAVFVNQQGKELDKKNPKAKIMQQLTAIQNGACLE